MKIRPPFADYPHSDLQDFVRAGFYEMEQRFARQPKTFEAGTDEVLSGGDFQILVAALYYLITSSPERN